MCFCILIQMLDITPAVASQMKGFSINEYFTFWRLEELCSLVLEGPWNAILCIISKASLFLWWCIFYLFQTVGWGMLLCGEFSMSVWVPDFSYFMLFVCRLSDSEVWIKIYVLDYFIGHSWSVPWWCYIMFPGVRKSSRKEVLVRDCVVRDCVIYSKRSCLILSCAELCGRHTHQAGQRKTLCLVHYPC